MIRRTKYLVVTRVTTREHDGVLLASELPPRDDVDDTQESYSVQEQYCSKRCEPRSCTVQASVESDFPPDSTKGADIQARTTECDEVDQENTSTTVDNRHILVQTGR